MTTYYIYAVTDEEYTKADKDWSYSPQEHKVGELSAETERQALNKLHRGRKSGKYPDSSQLRIP